jgi:hypothetical protein
VFIDPTGVIRSIVASPLDEAGAEAQIQAILPAAVGSSAAPSPSP